MADEKIKAYDRHGEKITISKAEIGKLYALGGKLATTAEVQEATALQQKEAAQKAVDARYDALPTSAKVLGAVNTATGALNPLTLGQNTAAPTSLQAYAGGVREGLTGGLAEAGTRKVVDVVGGKAAGDRFATQVEQERTASPTAGAIGEGVGLVAGSVLGEAGAMRALPTSGAAALGSAAERGIGQALAGVAKRGVLGKAAVTAAEMGTRGAIEGGIYSATKYGADEVLQDKELTTDTLVGMAGAGGTGALWGGLGGAALGGGGSLAASGARALGGKAATSLARVMAKEPGAVAGSAKSELRQALDRGLTHEEALAEIAAKPAAVADDAARVATSAAEAAPRAPTGTSKLKALSNQMAVDALGATKTQARSALEHVDADAVGEYVNRIGIGKAAEGQGFLGSLVTAGKNGRADDLLGVIQADKAGRIATGLSGAVKGIPARVKVAELAGHADALVDGMMKDPTKIAGADSFRQRVMLEASALHNAGKVAADGTIDAADAFYLRSSMAKQAYELGRASGSAGDAYKQFLRQWDNTTITALDQAAEKAGKSGLGDEIRHWKREWQLASAAEEMAEGGAERMTRNNTFGIRESIGAAVGLATGNPLMATATMFGGKLLRERGSAVAAQALAKMAEGEVLAGFVKKMNGHIDQAAKGLTQPPAKGLLKPSDRMPATKLLAKTAVQRIAEFQADPEAFVEKSTRQAERLAAHDPEVAQAVVQRQTQAMTFLTEKMPVTPDPDPLDPHPAPKMTPNEAAELGRYMWYVEKPQRFFAEAARGKLTYEGAETAQRLMPRAFEALQMQTMETLATQLSRGIKLPFRQRQTLGVLMGMATTPSQYPAHAAFLQKNLEPLPQEKPAPGGGSKSLAGPKLSALDRLEQGGVGHKS